MSRILQRPPKMVADVNLIHRDYSAEDIRSGNTIIIRTPQSIHSKVSFLQKKHLQTQYIYFSTSGGRNDIASKANVILRNIMTDFLAAQYSFHGSRNGKNSFVELNLHTVILRGVQTNLPNSTQHEIDNNIKSWLSMLLNV
ncbi:hypothetical protein QE152_g39033 [Popillia japonica]|uniref:Uncharacterized protein n=1 Tax=Popillia japonica TaxID=7064 RepID=A0AAW1HVG0_POPJA